MSNSGVSSLDPDGTWSAPFDVVLTADDDDTCPRDPSHRLPHHWSMALVEQDPETGRDADTAWFLCCQECDDDVLTQVQVTSGWLRKFGVET